MICNNRKYLFLHPPKNGGKSIEDALFDIKPMRGSSDHRIVSEYINDENIKLRDYYKFMFCRNPWDRLVSVYFARKQHYGYHMMINNIRTPSFNDWIVGPISNNGNIFNELTKYVVTQLSFLKLKNSKIIELDFLGRFETYNKDWDMLCKNLNINLELPHHFATRHDHYSKYYNSDTIDIVNELYKEDIEYFNYKFEKKG